MNWIGWTADALFGLATIYVLVRMQPMSSLISEDAPGRRTTRLVMRRGLWAMGWWQESVALVLVVQGQYTMPVALVLMGLYLMWGSRHLWLFGMIDA